MTVPKSFWDNEQLSIIAKWVAITIESYADTLQGCSMGIRAIQTATNLSAKEVKDALTELKDKGCLQVTLDQDGQKMLKILLYKDHYTSSGEKIVIGDNPTDSNPIDYQLIQDTWNTRCDNLSRLDKFTARRKQKTRTCLKGASATVQDMIKVIKLVATSAFLNGTKTDWQCSYDWIIKSPDNFTKIIEGQYHKEYHERLHYKSIMSDEKANPQRYEDEDEYEYK